MRNTDKSLLGPVLDQEVISFDSVVTLESITEQFAKNQF